MCVSLLVQQGLLEGEAKLKNSMVEKDKKVLLEKAHSVIILSLGDEVVTQVSKKKTVVGV